MVSTASAEILSGINAEYIAHLYGLYLSSPDEIDKSWQDFFSDLNDDEITLLQELHGASWTPEESSKDKRGFKEAANANNVTASSQGNISARDTNHDIGYTEIRKAALDSIRALLLIRTYRVRGHLHSDLDPLKLKERVPHEELDPEHFGFTKDDYDRPIFVNGALGLEMPTLNELIDALNETYCGTVGIEYMHLSDPDEKKWIEHRIEAERNHTRFTDKGKKAIYKRLVAAEMFENYLHKKHPGTKRFGLDGGEALIPAMEQIMKRGGQLGLKEIVLGMPHRGRLNVLTNVMGKSYSAIFSEFQGKSSNPDGVLGSGDVKYHLGTSGDRDFDGNVVHLSLTANPSHLEAVNPVVIGKVRAKQMQLNDYTSDTVMPILMHGDAAFAGQGIVAETLMISDLPGYRVGGTIHIVVNNQIGFTTMPQFSRSGPYPTDVARMLAAPIFHVNGDDPEAVVHVSRIAMEFRQEFKKDVVIDMFCYRRYGHNEGDEPAFTQPIMYKKIAGHPTTSEIYGKQLVAEGLISKQDQKNYNNEFNKQLDDAFEAVESYKPNKADYLEGAWSGLSVAKGDDRRGNTAISEELMQQLGDTLTVIPDGFNMNSKIVRQLKAKRKMFESGDGFDWATAEALAFGSLVHEGTTIRLSGQDCGRGTFSQRHAIIRDQITEEKYVPLQQIRDDDVTFNVHDSPLSEAAVLGFEYGFSLAEPNALILWEAQFGDFANGAQVLIDQFISSGESKWLRMSGLVMLLPHGYEGQGPEHSSARPERFLQMCADDNWQICNCTTPANYFHVLRRQMRRDFRKPLVIMTPKSLLRHKLAVSSADMFTGESTFHRYLWDDAWESLVKPEKMRRVILCSGKVYYDLYAEREARNIKDITILRLEQLYPFPHRALTEELQQYKGARFVWCQEEPYNMGSWSFVRDRIENILYEINHDNPQISYIGRTAAASPAAGNFRIHNIEQEKLINDALTIV
jgi:2-oxoglutarate dehydrogenase E1 component